MILSSWNLKTIKYTVIAIVTALISLISLTILLLFTHIGNQVSISIIEHFEPRLSIELIDGTVLREPKFQNISWVDGDTQIKINSADYQFDWSCLMTNICLKKLNISDANILIAEMSDDAKPNSQVETKSDPVEIDIPIKVSIDALNLKRINFAMAGLEVNLDSLSLQAKAFQKDIALSSQIKGLLIKLPNPPEVTNTAVTLPSTSEKQRINFMFDSFPAILTEEMLPHIALPINLMVEPIQIDNVKIEQDNKTIFELNSLKSAFTFKKTQLSISQFLLDIPETTLNLNGQIDFVDDYPLDLNINGQLKEIKQLETSSLLSGTDFKFNTAGRLSDLRSELLLSKKVNLQLTSHLDLFSDNLPHEITLDWQDLQWPLTGKAEYKSAEGHFTSKGSLLNYHINLLADYALSDLPAGKVSLSTKGDLQAFNIESLKVETLSGNADFSGILTFNESINWAGKLQINNIDLQEIDTQYDAQFSGIVRQQATVTLYENSGAEWQFDFPELDINGMLLSRPLSVSGRVSGDEKKGVIFDHLAVENVENRFVVDGFIADENNLKVALDIENISHLFIDAKGKIKGDVNLKGPFDALQVHSQLNAKKLEYQNYQIENIQLDSDVLLTEQPQLTLSLEAKNILAEAQQVDDIEIHISNQKIAKTNKGTDKSVTSHYRHQIKLLLSSELLSADLTAYITQTEDKLLTQLNEAKLFLPRQRLVLATPFDIIPHEDALTISPHCWKALALEKGDSESGKLCVKKLNIGESGHAIIDIDRYLLANLNPFFPDNFKIAGALSADADINWYKETKPTFKVNLFSDDMQVKINNNPQSSTFIDYPVETFTIGAIGDKQLIDIDAKIFSNNLIDLKLKGQLLPYKKQASIDSSVDINLPDFSLFLPLLPQLELLKGQLTSQLTIAGNIDKPIINGDVTIQNGQLSSSLLPIKITELQSKVIIADTKASLEGSFNSKDTNTIVENVSNVPILTSTLNIVDKSLKKITKVVTQQPNKEPEKTIVEDPTAGIAYIKGQLDWFDKLSGNIHLYAHKLEIYDYGKLDLFASPDIHIHVNENINIDGELLINKGKIVVKELPAGAISQSKDVVVIDIEEEESTPDLPVVIDLSVDMGKQFQVVALGLDTFIDGKLLIKKPLNKDLAINGKLSLVDGSYRSLGQQLVLQSSSVSFRGAPETPYLAIEAIRDPEKIEDDVTAGVRVTGTPDELELVIFSEPAMAQQEALSYITRGQSLDNTSGSNNTMANMLIDIAAGQSGSLMDSIGEGIGIKDLSLSSSGTGDDQSVGVRGEIAPGIEVSYGVGVFDNFSIFAIRYEMFERFFVEASSGVDQAVDAYYEWERAWE